MFLLVSGFPERFELESDGRRSVYVLRPDLRIESSPAYARSGAYLVADDPAAALSRFDDLQAVKGVERVEPQMLVEASVR